MIQPNYSKSTLLDENFNASVETDATGNHYIKSNQLNTEKQILVYMQPRFNCVRRSMINMYARMQVTIWRGRWNTGNMRQQKRGPTEGSTRTC